MLQILKCVTGNGHGSQSAASSPDRTDSIQIYPFGGEYTSLASKVPPLKKKGYDQKVDIWAVGCLLFELLTGAVAAIAVSVALAVSIICCACCRERPV